MIARERSNTNDGAMSTRTRHYGRGIESMAMWSNEWKLSQNKGKVGQWRKPDLETDNCRQGNTTAAQSCCNVVSQKKKYPANHIREPP